ncbi:MAG: VWA domain-containing protein [Candidatus Anammoximicrobium sp.]|nr:VWA domain-containing protein [Candidatus Anammoximicrobium sp.]
MPRTTSPLFSESTPRRTGSKRQPPRCRKGAILILFAVMLVVLMGMLAFAIDIGVMVHHRAWLHSAADAAALAAVAVLERGELNEDEVRNTANEYFGKQFDPDGSGTIPPGLSHWVQLGRWDPVERILYPGTESQLEVNAVRVVAKWQFDSYFGKVLGHASYTVGAEPEAEKGHIEAIATGGRDATGPRDIVLMIDQTSALLQPNSDEYAPGESSPNDYPLNAKRALKEAIEQFNNYVFANYPDDRIGISGFATNTALESPLTSDGTTLQNVFDISRPDAFLYSYDRYVEENGGRYPGEPPRLGLALDGSSQGQTGGYQIVTGAGSRDDAKKILVLIGDGSNTDDPDPKAVAAQLASARIHIHTITVGASNPLMHQLVTGDGRSYQVPTSASYADVLQAFHAAFDRISGKESTKPKLVK